jgi:hypothetical protein
MLVAAGVTELGRKGLDLDGWGDLSVWGWDDRAASLFAQLWPDADGDEDDDAEDQPPAIWITPGGQWDATGSPAVLAAWIAAATGKPLPDVLLAMTCNVPEEIAGPLRAQAGELERQGA